MPGIATVDDSAGGVSVTNMQFSVDGYMLFGDTLKLAGSSGNPVTIDVGDGTAGSVSYSAVINNVLIGDVGLSKVDFGTLVLAGDNTYSGGTTITAGTLQIGNGSATGAIVGGVTNNASLVFDRGDSLTYADVISGTGSLAQAGVNTLTLTGTNTYSGGTTIDAGTLQIGNGGTSGSIAGDVIDNSSLIFDRSDAVTYAGVISGTGNLSQNGTGTLTLTGTNTYTGVTNVNHGTLALIGNGSIAESNIVQINNNDGAFDISGTTGGAEITMLLGYGSVELGGRSLTLTDQAGFPFDGTISGTGGVSLLSGKLVLTGANTYSGLTTIGSNATLQVGDANTGASIVSDVLDNGTLEFLNSDDVVFSGAISGNGSLIVPGAGNLTLTGNNTFSGGLTIVGAGALVVSNDENLGAADGSITLEARLETAGSFTLEQILTLDPGSVIQTDANTMLTIPYAIDGIGALAKTGAGTLLLTGDNTYLGGTTISAGTLQIGNGGTSGSIAGVVTDNGSLVFDRSDAVTYGDFISGTGSVTQAGTGTLTLTGTNVYWGGPT